MKVYVVMKHENWTEGETVLDSVWHSEFQAREREKKIDNSRDYYATVDEVEV